MDVPPHVDATSEAESVQNAWGNDCTYNPSAVPETAEHPTDYLSTIPDTHQVVPTDADDEEFGEFVEASTDPLKRPIYDTTERADETLELLNNKSAPDWEESGIFVGTGLVEPVRVGYNMTAASVKKMARWKRNDTRANMIVAEWKKKKKREKEVEAARVSGNLAADTPSAKDDDYLQAESNQYLQVHRPMTRVPDTNGVMRPVRFAGSELDEMVEDERTAWGP
jgi:hypothetical protein